MWGLPEKTNQDGHTERSKRGQTDRGAGVVVCLEAY